MSSERRVRDAMAARAEHVELVLLTITSDEFDDGPLRLAQSPVDVTSRGDVFSRAAFDFIAPTPGATASAARLTVDNVDRRITDAVNDIVGTPEILVEFVLEDDPDFVELSLPPFKLSVINWDLFQVEGSLTHADDSSEPACAISYTPAVAPGIHP